MIRAHLSPGQTGVDVGAGCGVMTTIMLEQVGPTGRVIAIEPDLTGRKLKEGPLVPAASSLAYYVSGLTVWHCAVGECDGEVTVSGCGTMAASRWHGAKPSRTVPMRPLDALVKRADLVKIDAQGSESHILDGAPRLLAQCPVWILELWPWGLKTAGRTVWDVLRVLRGAGLTPYWAKGDLIEDRAVTAWLKLIGPQDNRHVNILARQIT